MKAKKLHLFEYNCLSFLLMRASFIGICLTNLILVSKQDSWISIIVAIILGFIPLIIYYLIINSNPKQNITEFIKEQCGPVLGGIINIAIALFTFLFISTILWDLINFISSQYLYKTPDLAISLTFAIVLYYIINKSINVIGRVAVIFVYILIALYLASCFGLFSQVDISNFKPILEHGFTPVLNGSFHYIAYNILPLFLISIIPKDYINDSKHFVRNGIITYLISIVSLLIVSFFLLSIYGIQISSILQYPAFHLLKRLSLIGFIQRIENILSIQWILDMVMFLVIGLYFIKMTFNTTFKLKEHKYTSFILILLLVIATNYLFPNNTVGNIFIMKYLPFMIFIFYLIIPAFIYIIKSIKKISH